MSISLLNRICDDAGNGDQLFIDYLNNRNIIHPSFVYILMVRGATHLVKECVKFGFQLDKNCMSIACIMLNCNLIELCIENNLVPTESDVNNIINQCVHVGKIYRKRFDITDPKYANIRDKNICFALIVEIASGSIPDASFTPLSNYPFNLLCLLKKIPTTIGCRTKGLSKFRVRDVTKCLNYLLCNGYSMTPNNWTQFNESMIKVGDIELKNNDQYVSFFYSCGKRNMIDLIKKKSVVLSKEHLVSAIKNNNIAAVEYIVRDLKLNLDNDIVDTAIKYFNLDIIEIIMENCTCQMQINDNTFDIIIANSLKKGKLKLLKLINDNFKKIPNKKTILQYVINVNPCVKYLHENNLLFNANNNDTVTNNNNQSSNTLIKNTNDKQSLWFMC